MIGESIRRLRKEKKLTLEELANNLNAMYPDTLNFNKGKLSKWENGKEEPKLSSIRILADYFGISIDSMYSGDTENNILTLYNKLNDNRQNKVLTYTKKQLHEQNNNIIQFNNIEDDKDIEIATGHKSAAGFAILGDDSNMTSTVMKASKVPSGADEIVEITGDSMEPLIMKGEQVFIRHQPSVENGEIAIVAILDDGITCKKVYYDDIEGNVTLESVNDDYEDMVFPAEEIRIIGKVLGK
ncbi:helix-turn-helix domain-containing protein [Carnobacterium maltaromaticum]|uniref:helix-turn-helix domain-containing protein n=1 Tax=Carnobacterium maltaromaticum TaxID=2751 RepID=UPI003C1FC7F3